MNIYQFLIGLSLIVGFAIIVRNVNWKKECADFIELLKGKEKV